MAISLSKLNADPTAPLDGQSIVSFLRDGSGNAITSTSGALDVKLSNASIVVTATNLSTRALVFATDKVDASGSAVSITGTVAVTQSTSPWVVSAVDLDIRNLAATQDSVAISDGTDTMLVNADGSINVVGSFTINGQYAEDSSHVSGNVGIYNLAVRSDAPAVGTSANGDYASQTVDAFNRSWVNAGSNVSLVTAASSVTTTSGLLIASVAGQRKMIVQNNGTKAIEIGASGVAIGGGLIIPAGGDIELEIGSGIALHAVATSGTQNIRVMQTA